MFLHVIFFAQWHKICLHSVYFLCYERHQTCKGNMQQFCINLLERSGNRAGRTYSFFSQTYCGDQSEQAIDLAAITRSFVVTAFSKEIHDFLSAVVTKQPHWSARHSFNDFVMYGLHVHSSLFIAQRVGVISKHFKENK